MKRVLLLLFCSTSLFAVPAKRTPTVVAQPDGTRFSVVGFGDEHYNYTETVDGYVVTRGSDGYWYYATLNPEGRFIPSTFTVRGSGAALRNQVAIAIPKHLAESPHVIAERTRSHAVDRTIGADALSRSIPVLNKTQAGVHRVLLLCVQFSDLAATQTSASFQDMVNNDAWKSGIGGMSRYYKDVSYNTISIQADYQDWIAAAHQSSYYAYSQPLHDTHIQELVSQCIDAAEANGVDFSLYDNDGDGAVDGLFVVHSGIGAEEGGQTQYIWSHSGSLESSYSRTYDGKSVSAYIMMPELYGSAHVDIGVFCHEYGHMLGLPDLYDTNGSADGSSEGLGNWCLMAGGSWGGDGSTPERPSHMSAYCKELLGYTVPSVVSSSQALSIPQAETNAFAYKIWMDDNQSDEYLLIENRQKTGFDANLPASGLLMCHVDRNLTDIYPASNSVNVASTHLGVKVYEADGLEQLAGGINRGNAGDPYPGSTGNTSLTSSTTPNSALWNTNPSGVAITDISTSSATMTATAVLPTYYGYYQQFYRKVEGWSYGTPTSNSGYGMVRCTPAFDGTLVGVRVFSIAGIYTSLTAAAFTSFISNTLSSQVGSAVSGASAGVDNYVQLNFSPTISVTQNVPIYVRVFFQKSSGGYAVPIDITLPATGNSYHSSDGTTCISLTPYDVAVRVVFRSNTPLPVELTSFTANTMGSLVALRWETASEKNNYGFEVEKDTARAQPLFTVIPGSFVPGHGTSLVPHTYTFIDSTVAPGRWAYRLKQMDLDGSVHVFDPVQIQLTLADVGIGPPVPAVFTLRQNYPNPFNPSTTIRYELPQKSQVTLTLFNTLGQHVGTVVQGEKEAGYHEVKFDAGGLSSGVYFYRMTAGSYVQTRKLLLLR